MMLDNLLTQMYVVATNEARLLGHEFVMPEHFIYSVTMFGDGRDILEGCGGNIDGILNDLMDFFKNHVIQVHDATPMESIGYTQMWDIATKIAKKSTEIEVTDVLRAIFELPESFATYILAKNGVDKHMLTRKTAKTPPKKAAEPAVNTEISKYAVDLIGLAMDEKLDPLVGREKELDRTVQVLCRRLKNNPVHVGDPGVGKTALVEGLAQRIAAGEVPDVLKSASLFRIDMGSLVAGTKYRGDFEERLVKLFAEIAKTNKPIVYIDEIHTVVGAGAVGGGSIDATSIIKPYLARGEIKFIGSTTHDEYKKHIEKDRALARRLAKIDINEPSEDECLEILKGLRGHYEDFHQVKYSDHVLTQIVNLSAKHMTDKFLPDKAIDVMDEAGVVTFLGKKNTVTVSIVERVVSLFAKIPEKSVNANEAVVLKNLEANLCKAVVGQDDAMKTITHAIHSSRAGLNEPGRPVANLLFVGPTGVGKTEAAKQLASLLSIPLTRFDMSEYQEKHAVARLIGSPPGYVGYEEGGLLTDAVRRTPHSVLLLDEIEKAHPDILNIMLQVMDYGVLTDNRGKKADFSNTIIIMTSNAGARELQRHTIGFGGGLDQNAASKEIDKLFSPEFRNRLDSIAMFNQINEQMAYKIAKKSIDKLAAKLSARGVAFSANKAAITFIARRGLSDKYGAREIIRMVENDVKQMMVQEVLFGKLKGGGRCKLVYDGKSLQVQNLVDR